MRRLTGDPVAILVGGMALVVALVFLVYPLVNGLLLAFVRNGSDISLANLTLVNFERFFVSTSYRHAFMNSIVTSGGATLLAAALGVPMAFAVARVEIAWRPVVLALSVIPLIAPPFIGAYAWVRILGNNGIVTQLLIEYLGVRPPPIYGIWGVTIALALSYLPYLFLMVQGTLAASDPTIEEAARMTGASSPRILRTITLPLAAPAIAAGMLVVFIKALGDFGVPSILGGEMQVLPTLIYYQIHGFFNLNAGSAIAIVNVLLTIMGLGLLALVNRRSVSTLTGSSRGSVRARGVGSRIAANVYIWFVLILALLPQALVALYSFSLRWGDTLLPSSYGLDNYRSMASEAFTTMGNSIVLSGLATLCCVIFGAIAAYATARGRIAAKWAIDLTIMLPFVLPGLVVGVVYLGAFNDGPLVLTGTAAILIFAYFTRRVAFVFRSAATAVAQIDTKIEEASTVCGASWGTTMRRIMVPLVAPGLLAASILVFATLIGEISATVLLYSANWKPISIAIYERVLGNELARASALGTICNLATLALILMASRLAGRSMSDMFR
ncbi:ABC transporter permease [Microvirga alba]|uniref:Iron ABC transporter permease n=1 Tax=Microvirga alba TaxID=2791025 RepID=A0A931FSM2_9HYPH|nr:iron ABC transporter permease [Microvirga alba]MBF9235763.1 iron ABC transporter permease [Microvirga alba]